MHLIFFHGPVSSGKYTIAKELSQLMELPLFHNHLTVDLVTSLFEFGTSPFINLRERLWLAAFEEAARAGQSFIFTFNPEATVDADFIEKASTIVEKEGGTIHFVEISCSEQEIEARIENKSRAAFGKLNSLALYRQLRDSGAFDFPTLPDPLITVASSSHSPAESAALIKERLTLVM